MLRWQLPEYVSDAMPSEARRIEDLRRHLLDLYRSYGYELIAPPLIEHLESLLTGAGSRLAMRTFQIVDQLSGRMLGVRADITPQAARIDAHLLNRQGVTRLCYAGPVLHTRPGSLVATREPYQVGAELFGHAGQEAELEVLELMVRSVHCARIDDIRIDLSHAAIVPALLSLLPAGAAAAERDPMFVDELYRRLVQKDEAGLQELLADCPNAVREGLVSLCGLYGPVDAAGSTDESGLLAQAAARLPDHPLIGRALADLSQLIRSSLWTRMPEVSLAIDLADLQGYHYYSGMSFAAFAQPGQDGRLHAEALARGGRYDGSGDAFGRNRPAVGFSLELRTLTALGKRSDDAPRGAVLAPWRDDPDLRQAIAELRARDEIVLQVLPGHEQEQREFDCDRELVFSTDRWELKALVNER